MKAAASRRAHDSEARELRVDRLLGRQVLSVNNRATGRIEEFRVEKQGRDWVITEYLIGAAGLFERLHVSVKILFGKRGGGYVARWDQLDISDPQHPRLRCPVDQLRRF